MNNPLVSVCMPAYNAEAYIEAALDSVLSQTYSDIEIIVVNDGSTDNTYSILKSYEEKGVKLIDQENKGQCVAANRAFQESKGELIKFFDADDILNADNIELQVQKLNGNYDYIASSEWARFYKKTEEANFKPEKVWKDMPPVDWLVTSWENAQSMMQCALWLIPRKILEKSGLWNEDLSLINDFEFFTRVILASSGIKFTAGAKLYYRSGLPQGSLSGIKSRNGAESALKSITLGTNYLLEHTNSDRTRRIVANCFQSFVYDFYLLYPDLTTLAEERIKELGGSSLPFPAGNKARLLANVIGWKNVQKLKKLI